MRTLLNGTHAPIESSCKTTTKQPGWRENRNMIVTTGPAPMTMTKKKKGYGELAGGTAAECAAVCCCCPCALMDLLVLAVVKLPAGLCKKAKKRHRLMRKKKKRQQSLLAAAPKRSDGGGSLEELEREIRDFVEKGNKGGDEESEAVDLEKEMWGRFLGTGFWRSPSQRDIDIA